MKIFWCLYIMKLCFCEGTKIGTFYSTILLTSLVLYTISWISNLRHNILPLNHLLPIQISLESNAHWNKFGYILCVIGLVSLATCYQKCRKQIHSNNSTCLIIQAFIIYTQAIKIGIARNNWIANYNFTSISQPLITAEKFSSSCQCILPVKHVYPC